MYTDMLISHVLDYNPLTTLGEYLCLAEPMSGNDERLSYVIGTYSYIQTAERRVSFHGSKDKQVSMSNVQYFPKST